MVIVQGMMDADNIIPISEAEVVDHNWNHSEHPDQQQETIVAKVALGIPDTSVVAESSNVELKETDNFKNSRPHIGQVKAQTKNVLGSKNASSALLKRMNNPKQVKTTSNGTVSASAYPKQSVMKSRSLNDGLVNSNMSKTKKATSAIANALKPKTVKPDSATLTENVAQSEGIMEKAKLRPFRKGPPTEAEGEPEANIPPSEDAKSNRVGKLPTYCFSFRCDERAEKRKEFYSKVEEKIHAKEVEKSNLKARSKETQAAEIKMLRKSLTFKATPIPSFYQEPAPAKVELKKIPPTRPRSPKLGRNKTTSSNEDAEEEGGNGVGRYGRLSLDRRIAESKKPTKVPTSTAALAKKPLRRSLPRLPSENTRSLPNTTALVQEDDDKHEKTTANRDTDLAQGQPQQPVATDDGSGETQPVTGDNEPPPLVQDKFRPDSHGELEQQSIAIEEGEIRSQVEEFCLAEEGAK
ncbi:hypothetical protein Dimus_019370 [Dionaea muscipula]